MVEILKEILKNGEQSGEQNNFSFYQYVDKSEIYKKMLDDLLGKKYSRKQNKKGFFIAENERNKIGIISQCLGLESIAMSANFGYDIFSNDDKKNEIIKDIILDTVKQIFDGIQLTEDKVGLILAGKCERVQLVYDASPYVFNDDIEDEHIQVFGYVDTMAKLLETFVEFRNLLYAIEEKHQLVFEIEGISSVLHWTEAAVIKVVYDLNEACIANQNETSYVIEHELKDKYGQGMLYRGWNYIPMSSDAEPSLYFTYAVCSAYMSLVSNISEIISAVRKAESEMTIEQLKKNKIPDIQIENNAKMKRDYEFLSHFYASYVGFNKRCVDAGHHVDTQIRKHKIDITQNFIGQGYSEVNIGEILNSTTNDAMINTLLAVFVMVYSGTDLDYAAAGREEDFNDQLQYAIQNIFKSYRKLERSNKNHVVDQLFLTFNEQIPATHQEQVRLLRKQRILTNSLLPLLVKAHTAVSRYIIEYPQKEMVDYLKIILENRCVDKNTNEYLWIWDKDGYNLAVNFMYLLNILSFFTYYEMYEYPFTNDPDSFNIKLEKRDEAYKAEIKDIKAEYEKRISELKESLHQSQENEKRPRPIEKEVIDLVDRYLDGKLSQLITEAFRASRDASVDQKQDELSLAFRGMFLSMFAGDRMKALIDAGETAEDGKFSNNGAYRRTENKMFELFEARMIRELENELGKN